MRAQYLESLSLNCEQSFPRFSTHTMHKCVCLLQQFYIYFPIEHAKCCMAYAIQTGRYVVFFFLFLLFLSLSAALSFSLVSSTHFVPCPDPFLCRIIILRFGAVTHTHVVFASSWMGQKERRKERSEIVGTI